MKKDIENIPCKQNYPCTKCRSKERCEVGKSANKNCELWRNWFSQAWKEVVKPLRRKER